MRFFRSEWLKGIYPLVLLALLGAGPFVVLSNQYDGSGDADFVIRAPQPFGTVIASLRMLRIIYSLEATHTSQVLLYTKIISENHIPGTSFDPIFTDILTNPNRGPPHLLAFAK